MGSVCGSISADVFINCDEPLVAGANDRLILFNRDDLLSVVKNVNPLIIEDITLVPGGAEAFEYQGKNNSVEPSHELLVKEFAEVYAHSVKYKVFSNNGATKAQLEQLAKARVVAIVQNNHLGAAGESAFEIYGLDSGLTLVVHTRTVADDATQGAYDLELKSAEKSPEPHVPASFFLTSFAITKALVDDLLIPTT